MAEKVNTGLIGFNETLKGFAEIESGFTKAYGEAIKAEDYGNASQILAKYGVATRRLEKENEFAAYTIAAHVITMNPDAARDINTAYSLFLDAMHASTALGAAILMSDNTEPSRKDMIGLVRDLAGGVRKYTLDDFRPTVPYGDGSDNPEVPFSVETPEETAAYIGETEKLGVEAVDTTEKKE